MTHMAALAFGRSQRLPIVVQNEMAECGQVCVAMVSRYWGHDLDLHALRQISKPSQRGMTMRDMVELFDELGFRSRALQVPVDGLAELRCPAILHWNMNHFVVLKQMNKRHAIIHDPASGLRRCSLDELSQSFTGVALEVEPSAAFQPLHSNQPLRLPDLARTVQGINRVMLVLLLLSLSIEVLALLNPLFLQVVTDNVIGAGERANLYVIASGFVLLLLVQILVEYVRGHLVIYISNHLTEQFASNVLRHLLKLPLAFFEARHKGDIQSRFQSIDNIQKKIGTDFINTVLDGLMILVNLTVMLVYSPLLTALVLLSLATYFLVRYTSYRFLKRQMEASVVQHARASSLFLETLQGIVSIKSFAQETGRFNLWRNRNIASLNADIRMARVHVAYNLASRLLQQLEHILVVCVGATMVLANRFSVGMLIAFLAYRLLLVNRASSFIQYLFDYRLLSVQLDRLGDILFQPAEVVNSGMGHTRDVAGALRLQGLGFQYHPKTPPVLHNLDLSIAAGEKVAIIGPSGCGKSTLLKVMMGLLEATSGELSIDGMPLSVFGLKDYRQVIAAVMQDDALLSGSIRDNIAFFDEAVDLARVIEVAQLAHIHEDICRFPMGYETLVGDMGSSLSGGQKQRLLLARALYKQPRILFLDEATSHLDVANERDINQALKALTITQVVIAHRKETIDMADRVIDLSRINVCDGA